MNIAIIVVVVVYAIVLAFSIALVSIALAWAKHERRTIALCVLFRLIPEVEFWSRHVGHAWVLLIVYTVVVLYLLGKDGGGPKPKRRKPLRDTEEHQHLPSVLLPEPV